MDASIYTLMGALGGVTVTQVANYFLEGRKSDNQMALKKLELEEQRKLELSRERRDAYAKYMVDYDHYLNDPSKGPESVISSYYSALILATEETSTVLKASFNFVLDGEVEQIMDCKSQLYKAMQREIEI